jgi:mono/diheme cytochrome c family protein
MKRVLRWLGIGLGILAGLLIVALGAVYLITEMRFSRTLSGVGEPVVVPADPAVVAEGKRLVVARGCADCHGQQMAGDVFVDDPLLGRLSAPNLTAGQGGVGATYDDADFERAIRHGVGADAKPLLIMPSHEYYPLSDTDVGAIIAYLRSAPPVDNILPSSSIGPLGRVLGLAGAIVLTPVDAIDESKGRISPPPGVTAEFGQYLGAGCTGCHGHDYAGGPNPVPGGPPVANLTPHPTDGIGSWSEAEFIRAMREGVRPDGTPLDPAMPWQNLGTMNDTELKALYTFLRTLPPLPDQR